MITYERILDDLSMRIPEFVPQMEELRTAFGDDGVKHSIFSRLAEFAIASAHAPTNSTSEFLARILDFVEEAQIGGDDYVLSLIALGFLEELYYARATTGPVIEALRPSTKKQYKRAWHAPCTSRARLPRLSSGVKSDPLQTESALLTFAPGSVGLARVMPRWNL